MDSTTKTFLWIGIGVIAIIVLNKLVKKNDEPFILAQEGGEIQTRPLQKS